MLFIMHNDIFHTKHLQQYIQQRFYLISFDWIGLDWIWVASHLNPGNFHHKTDVHVVSVFLLGLPPKDYLPLPLLLRPPFFLSPSSISGLDKEWEENLLCSSWLGLVLLSWPPTASPLGEEFLWGSSTHCFLQNQSFSMNNCSPPSPLGFWMSFRKTQKLELFYIWCSPDRNVPRHWITIEAFFLEAVIS